MLRHLSCLSPTKTPKFPDGGARHPRRGAQAPLCPHVAPPLQRPANVSITVANMSRAKNRMKIDLQYSGKDVDQWLLAGTNSPYSLCGYSRIKVPRGGGVKRQWGCPTTAIFSVFGGHFFGNFRPMSGTQQFKVEQLCRAINVDDLASARLITSR